MPGRRPRNNARSGHACCIIWPIIWAGSQAIASPAELPGLVGAQAHRFASTGMLPLGSLIAGIFMIALGLYLAGWWRALAGLETAGRYLWRWIQPFGRWFPAGPQSDSRIRPWPHLGLAALRSRLCGAGSGDDVGLAATGRMVDAGFWHRNFADAACHRALVRICIECSPISNDPSDRRRAGRSVRRLHDSNGHARTRTPPPSSRVVGRH